MTGLPHLLQPFQKESEEYGMRMKKKRSKVETADAALLVINGSSENKRQEIYKSNMKRGRREMEGNNVTGRENVG